MKYSEVDDAKLEKLRSHIHHCHFDELRVISFKLFSKASFPDVEFIRNKIYGYCCLHPEILDENGKLLDKPCQQKFYIYKTYKNQIHTIFGHDGMYEYGRQTYKSLTSIAIKITGQKSISGTRFFKQGPSCKVIEI